MLLMFPFKFKLTRHFNSKMLSTISGSVRKTKIAVLQLRCTSNKDENFKIASDLIEQAENLGAKAVFLPECFDYVSESKEQAIELAETLNDNMMSKYKSLAKRLGIWMSLGGMHEKRMDDPKRTSNCHVMINNDGEIVSTYRKVHLFDLDIPGKITLRETNFTVPGEKLVPPVMSPFGAIGLGICYDVRFPAMSEWLRLKGAQILTFPSTFTVVTGKAHWHTLMKARAIENQCYVISAAQEGNHNLKRSSYGHSVIIDPWGNVLVDLESKTPSFGLAEIDLDLIETKRREMPVEAHRRKDLYGSYNVSEIQGESFLKGTWSQLDSGYFQFGPEIKVEDDCLFLKTEKSVAFVNISPIVQGHVLVSPKRQRERVSDLRADEISDLWITAQKVQKAVEAEYNAESSTLTIQDGKDAGQSVPHVHIHILPRRQGDFAKNDDVYVKLQNHDKDENRSKRSLEEMKQEALRLRKYFYKN